MATKFLYEEEFGTDAGRKDAWYNLMVQDHGWVRKVYDNSHWLSEEMVRTYQPSPAALERWAAKGIRTVINLRGKHEHREGRQPGFYWLEREACERLGMTMVNHKAWSREAPLPSFVTGLDEIFRTIEYPALMHCKSGADRAGIASVLYLFLRKERPLDEALEQLTYRYGHVKSGKTGALDHFFDVYRQAAAADDVVPSRTHFLEWVTTRYDQKAVTESFRPTAHGTFLTDVILRRE